MAKEIPKGKESEKQTEAAEEGAPAKSRKLLFIVLAALLVLCGAGGGAFFFLRSGDASHAGGEKEAHAEADEHGDGEAHGGGGHGDGDAHGDAVEAEVGASEFVPLETLIVNLTDGDRTRYLKVAAELELSGPGAKGELESRMPQVKDFAIGLLSSRTPADLQTLEGKAELREELQTRVNALLKTGRVLGVYFTEFVIQ